MPKPDPPSISDSHFVSLPSTEEAERVQNYNHTQAVFYAPFSVLWIKMLPSFSHSVYSLIHLPPSCWANMLVLNLPPLHNPSFFPLSVNHLLAYYTPSPIYRSHSFLFLSLSFPSILLSITHSSLALSFFSFITFRRLSHQLSHSSHLTHQILSHTLLSPHYNIVEKGEKINRFKQTNQSSGNSLFVREIKITGWWMNMLTLYFPLNEPLSLRLWHGSTWQHVCCLCLDFLCFTNLCLSCKNVC